MSDMAATNQPIPDEMLEDGEIDDDEIITEETEVVEDTLVEPACIVRDESSAEVSHHDRIDRSDGKKKETDDREEEGSTGDDRRKSHKKHQRKRRKHRDSKERELKSEKKERRRNKRKMHGYDDGTETQEHGDSLSPHSKRKKKRKKHSRDRRDRGSTTPDSDDSMEEYPQSYYGANNGYTDEYGSNGAMYTSSKSRYHKSADHYYSTNTDQTYAKTEPKDTEEYESNGAMYTSSKSRYHKSADHYYSTKTDQTYVKTEPKDYENNSGSDFEAHLAEYKNYKTHGDSYSKERDQEKNTETVSNGGEMYEEFMEYEENPKRLCKFFLEGKCLKGNECSFSHDQSARKGKTKKREICKYYLAGHCHHGDQCSYMHGDYPCKYFHTGVTCYAGDKCRFSHDPANDETQEIIDNFKDVLGNVDDSWEISELAKHGITVKPKPPPGVGLLPTPDTAPSTENELASTLSAQAFGNSGGAIPSIFDISVAPTAEFQKRISLKTERRIEEIDTAHILLDLSNVASLSMKDKSSELTDTATNQLPPQMYPSPVGRKPKNNGAGLLPTPNTLPINLNRSNQNSGNYFNNFVNERHDSEQNLNSAEQTMQLEDVIQTEEEFIPVDHTTTEDEQSGEAPLKVPDFLPATQKALFMRIHGKKVSTDQDKGSDKKNIKREDQGLWAYSSDEDEKPSVSDAGIIKMEADSHPSMTNTTSTSAAVESLLKMISKGGGNTANLDANLLSKVASVINMPNTTMDSYGPSPGIATYNPAQSKVSPRRLSTAQQRERKNSGSISSSPTHHKPASIRRRLSTQELTKEPVVIPLVAKQTGNQSMHPAHPDPRITLSRLIGKNLARFAGSVPKFSKDLILPSSSQVLGMKVTLTTDDSKSVKRDPRLGRQKDPRLQRSTDPRLKNRNTIKPIISSALETAIELKSSVPSKPSALLTKSSMSIPSLPELDLNLAYVQQRSKENGDTHNGNPAKATTTTYSLPTLKLPRLVKAPDVSSSPAKDTPAPESSFSKEPTMPKIAPYDPRYMSAGNSNTTDSSELRMTTAPYDPRVLSGQASMNTSGEIKKRTIQLPKLTPAPLYKPVDATPALECPEGDQGDF